MTDHGVRRPEQQRGQGLVEFTLVLPIILVLVLSVAELGLIFSKMSSLGYGTREGARTGSALALGDRALCTTTNRDPSGVDKSLVAAVQRILKTPDSGIDITKIQEIRIFEATESGAEAGPANVWTPTLPGTGPDVDPGPGTIRIDFKPPVLTPWPACDRSNGGTAGYDSLGVTIKYKYEFMTPLASFIDAVSGGALSLTLTETTVMALNPTI